MKMCRQNTKKKRNYQKKTVEFCNLNIYFQFAFDYDKKKQNVFSIHFFYLSLNYISYFKQIKVK